MFECKACKAKDKTIVTLAEQVDWLRMQLGTPWSRRAEMGPDDEKSPGFVLTSSPYISDEESDIEHMRSHGLISEIAAQAALEQVGALSTDIHIE